MIRVAIVEPGVIGFPGVQGFISHESQASDIVLVEPITGRESSSGIDVAVCSTSAYGLSLLPGLAGGTGDPFSLLLLGGDVEELPDVPRIPLRAFGILPRDAAAGEVSAAVRALAEGLAVGAPELLGPLLLRALSGEPFHDGENHLTAREKEVLAGLAAGRANKQIAGDLGISEHTVKYHTSSIYGKLGATNRAAAVAMGIRFGLLHV